MRESLLPVYDFIPRFVFPVYFFVMLFYNLVVSVIS